MISDLMAQSDDRQEVEGDVLIIGAGIAGLMLAARLRRKQIKVLIFESGGLEQASETHPLNRVVELGDEYSGATRGRFRCLGGTSTRWGGALIPFVANDLSPRSYLDQFAAFPVGSDAIQPYLSTVEQLFDIDSGSYEEKFVEEIGAAKYIPTKDFDFKVRFAKWPSFKRRNVAALFNRTLQTDPNLQVYLNSTATTFNTNKDNGRIVSITGRSQNGKSITVTAKHFVICAGAIETTRLLLLLDRQHDQRIFEGCEALGRYFYDHISSSMASIQARDVKRLNRLAAFRFVGSTMRSLRFELSPAAQERERVGSAFGHISFKTERDTGFDVLRNLLRSKQRGGKMDRAMLLQTLHDMPYFANMAYWRVAHKQLLWPVPATYELHVVAEQLPRSDNFISLSSEVDEFGSELAAIRWRVSVAECNTFDVFQRLFGHYWDRQGMKSLGELVWTNAQNSKSIANKSQADVYHPGGSTRMGTDRRSAVVNADLGVFGVPNLWTASTAVFPNGGGANPTLTLMLFTLRLADHLTGLLFK